MMKFYKLLFVTTLIIGTLISISSYTWMGMWMGLEINLISMIPLMSNSNNILSSESSIKYFITQAMASIILMFSIIMIMSTNLLESSMFIKMNFSILMNCSLLTKMGSAPFHFWFPEVMEGLSWINSTIMLTWQKIAPLTIFSYTEKTQLFMMMIIISSMIISGILGLNQISMRKILAFSSINHIGWMISLMMVSETMWTAYFIIYMIININVTVLMWKLNSFSLKQVFNSMNNNNMLKISFMINFMSMGGIPPFIGFFPKWIVIQSLSNEKMYLLMMIMIMMSMMTLYFYMRTIFSSLILKSEKINWSKYLTLTNLSFLPTINFLINISLIICTSMFNWM